MGNNADYTPGYKKERKSIDLMTIGTGTALATGGKSGSSKSDSGSESKSGSRPSDQVGGKGKQVGLGKPVHEQEKGGEKKEEQKKKKK